jgi:hypothetical protein
MPSEVVTIPYVVESDSPHDVSTCRRNDHTYLATGTTDRAQEEVRQS